MLCLSLRQSAQIALYRLVCCLLNSDKNSSIFGCIGSLLRCMCSCQGVYMYVQRDGVYVQPIEVYIQLAALYITTALGCMCSVLGCMHAQLTSVSLYSLLRCMYTPWGVCTPRLGVYTACWGVCTPHQGVCTARQGVYTPRQGVHTACWGVHTPG